MEAAQLQEHLTRPRGIGHVPRGASTGAAGGARCGDLVRLSVSIERDRVTDAGFAARGCATLTAAASAAVALVRGRSVLDAARVGPDRVAAELGGLIAPKRHAADLAADALHRALGSAVRRQATTAAEPRRVLVAMSGGVDSAVAALLCDRGGDEVAAVTLELWADRDNDAERSCCSAQAVRVARALAHGMGLPHFTLDLRAEFGAGVVEPFVEDHRAGLTPNPCVRCNGHVRLDAMLDFAGRLGAPALATGHYARVTSDGEGPVLRSAADPAKDQSYMLAAVAPATLARLRFPLGELRKPQVRELAGAAGLPVATKAESQDLCFLAGTDRQTFLARHGGMRELPGEIVDRRGRVLGRHRGQHAFTVGQRRGIGVAAAQPLYVLAKDPAANRVTVGPRPQLGRSRVVVAGATLHRDAARVDRVKLRYRSRPVLCRVAGHPPAGRHRRLELELGEPVEGAAPGQLACLMSGDLVVGHATIAPYA
ncbi:MAG: tRNA 2-thiouridine(34) synthase MnmA [Solirubrobacteraceae bacterium]